MWFIGAEVEQETSAPPPKKNPGSAPGAEEELSKRKCTLNGNILTLPTLPCYFGS